MVPKPMRYNPVNIVRHIVRVQMYSDDVVIQITDVNSIVRQIPSSGLKTGERTMWRTMDILLILIDTYAIVRIRLYPDESNPNIIKYLERIPDF